MEITFVSPVVNLAGGTRVIAVHAEALTQRGHKVRVISPPRPPIPLRRQLRSLLTGKGWPQHAYARGSHLDGRNIEHHVLERWRPVVDTDVPDGDVVIATWWETAEWVNALRPSTGAKVYFIQGHEIFPNLPLERCEATYRLPLHKIVVSRWLQEIMSVRYADPLADLVLNSVDHKQFHADPRGKQAVPTAGFIYSNGEIKGVDAVMSALSAARKRFPELRLVSFSAERPSRGMLPLPEGCEFTFSPPQGDLRKIYSRCDVWLSASRSDGFNLPVMEAMACRTPAVATRTGWPLHALQSGKNGMLVNIDDHAALVAGLEWVLTLGDEEWRRVSAAAHATATAGSWEQSTRDFESALQRACERSRRGEIAGRCTQRA